MRYVAPLLAVLGWMACDPNPRTADRSPTGLPGAPDPVRRSASAPNRSPDASPTEDAADLGFEPVGTEPPTEPADLAPLDEEPLEPSAPPNHGLIAPSDPPPDPAQLTLHALAGYEVVAIYDKPDIASTKLGYLRIGQRLKVTPAIPGTGCPGGFHQLAHGGYACASKGLVVDAKRPPYMYRPPPPPRVDQSFPYEYAFVHRWNSPMWWRVPTTEELAIAEDRRAELEALRSPPPPPPEADPEAGGAPLDTSPGPGSKPETTGRAAALPSVDDPASPGPAAQAASDPPSHPTPTTPGDTEPTEDVDASDDPPEVSLPLNPEDPWLERGFFISLAEELSDDGPLSWWKTARGGYVSTKDARPYTVKDFQGAVLPEGTDFPFGFVMVRKDTDAFELPEDGKLHKVDKIARRTFVDLIDETEIGGKAYMLTADGQLVRKDHIRLAERQPMPEGLEPWERWIDVDLDKQMLVAYEGNRPVYVTLVSSGRKGTADEPFETPTGRWRIRSKHISSTMDGNTASNGNYSIQDVPWAMFFQGSFALHGAFWHDGFGQVRSHGCVNLGATDARWLFYWTTPFLPEGWHGVHAHEGSPGTTVVIRKPSAEPEASG